LLGLCSHGAKRGVRAAVFARSPRLPIADAPELKIKPLPELLNGIGNTFPWRGNKRGTKGVRLTNEPFPLVRGRVGKRGASPLSKVFFSSPSEGEGRAPLFEGA